MLQPWCPLACNERLITGLMSSPLEQHRSTCPNRHIRRKSAASSVFAQLPLSTWFIPVLPLVNMSAIVTGGCVLFALLYIQIPSYKVSISCLYISSDILLFSQTDLVAVCYCFCLEFTASCSISKFMDDLLMITRSVPVCFLYVSYKTYL